MKKNKIMFENIYDLIKECSLSQKENGEWAILSRKFGKEARKQLHNFIKDKHIEWDGDNNIISIGRNFKCKLLTI